MQREIDNDSESEKEVKDSTIMRRYPGIVSDIPVVPKLEIPFSVKDIISKIEQAQLHRAREDIHMQLADIMNNVHRIITRFTAVDLNAPSGRSISSTEYKKKWRTDFLEKMATYAKTAEIREKTLAYILAWLEKWNVILSEMTVIDVDEHHHWIAQMEMLPDTFKAIENNVKILTRISTSLLEEKKKQKKEILSRSTLWKSWKERVIKRPATARALRPDQMISDQFATDKKVSEIQDMLQELIGTAMFTKLENHAIKYISSTIINLSKALSVLNDELKVTNFQSVNMDADDTRETEKELFLRIIQDLSEENEMLQRKLQDAEEKCEKLIQSKVVTAYSTSSDLKVLPGLSSQSSMPITKDGDTEDSVDSMLAKEFENIEDEVPQRGIKVSGIKWDSAISYRTQVEMAPDLTEQQYPLPEKKRKRPSEDTTEDITEANISLKKGDVFHYQSQKRRHPYVHESSGSNLSDNKGEWKVSEAKLNQYPELQALEKKRKEIKLSSEDQLKLFTESKSQHFPSPETKSQGGKSGTSSMWEQLRKLKTEYALVKSPIPSETKVEPITESMDKERKSETSRMIQFDSTSKPQKVKIKGQKYQISSGTTTSKERKIKEKEILSFTKQVKSHQLVKSQSRIAKETSESTRGPESPDGKSEQSNLEEFQNAIMAFLKEKIDNVGKPFDKKTVLKEEELLKRAEVEKLRTIKAKMEEYFQKVAETVTKTLKKYKYIKKEGQVGEKPMKTKKVVPFTPGLHFQKSPISSKSEISTFLSSESTDPIINNLTQMILAEIENETDVPTVSILEKDDEEKEREQQEEYLKEGEEKMSGMSIKHQLQKEKNLLKKTYKMRNKHMGKKTVWLQMKEGEQEQQEQKQWQEEEVWKEQQKQRIPNWIEQDKMQKQMEKEEEEHQKPKQQLEAWEQNMKEQGVLLEKENREKMRQVQEEVTHLEQNLRWEKEEEKPRTRREEEDLTKQQQDKAKKQTEIEEKNLEELAKPVTQTTMTLTPRWKTISKDIVQLYQGEKFHRNLKTLEILQDGRQSIPISPPTSTQLSPTGALPIPRQPFTKYLTHTPEQAQDMGITLIPQQIQAQGVTLTPQQAQELGITLTPEQLQAQGITLTPQQVQDLGITPTTQQIQAQGITLPPQQIQAQGIILSPQQAQDLGISLTPQQIQAQRISLTPQQAQDLGITLTPQQIQAEVITLTPQQAQDLGITLTSQQIQAQGVTLTPQQAQDLGITPTSQQIQAQGVTLTPQQAQDLGITPTSQQIQAQGVTLTPQQAQELGITLTPEQLQAQEIILSPQQAQEQGITLTSQQIEAQGITLTPQQAQDLGISLTPNQIQAQGISLTPQQAQELGITLTPQQIQAQRISLTPQQAQDLGITLTLQQTQAEVITLTPQQVQDLGITHTPQQIQDLGITHTPQQIKAQGVTLTPQQVQDLGITLTPQQIKAQGVTLTPQQAQDLGITHTPQQIQAQGVTLTPQQAQDLGVTLTPQHAQDLGITLTPQQAQDLGITLTPQQIQAQGFTLTPQQAQDLGITLTPQQIQAQGVTLTPQQAQDLGITVAPQQIQAQGVTLNPLQIQAEVITLTPQQIQAEVITLTPQQAQDLGITLTPKQIQAQGITLTPQQIQAQGVTLNPQQAQDLGITLTPHQIKAQEVTLTPQQAQDLGVTLTPQQIKAQGVTLTPQQAQDLGVTLTPQQIQAEVITLTPQQIKAQGVTLTPQEIKAQEITLTPQQAQALGITLTPKQIQAQVVTLTPQQAQDLGVTLTPQQIQAQGVTLNPQQAQDLGITLTPQQAQDLGITLTPQQIKAQGVTLTPHQAQDLGITLTPQQIQAQGVTLNPQQAQDLGITLTPQQIQAQGVTLTPQQIQAQGVTLTPQPAQDLGITLTPQQIQAQGVTLTPQQAQDLGITLTPQRIQAQEITLTPQQAQELGITLTPKQIQAQEITLTPQQAQDLGITFTPQQIQAQGVTLTPQQAQDLGITLTPQQIQAQGVTLTPQQAQDLGITLTPKQIQAQGVTLTPQQIQAQGVILTPQQAQELGITLTPLQIQAQEITLTPQQAQELGITLTPKQIQAQEITLTPQQAQELGITFTPQQIQAQGVTLTPQQAQDLGITLTPQQIQAQGVTLTPQQAQDLGITLTPQRIQAQEITLTPQQAEELGITLIPQEVQDVGFTLSPQQAQAMGITLTPEQAQVLGAPVTPVQAQALQFPLTEEQAWKVDAPITPEQLQEASNTITLKRFQALEVTSLHQQTQAFGTPLIPEWVQAMGVSITPKNAWLSAATITPEQTQALGSPITLEQAQALGVPFSQEQLWKLGVPVSPDKAHSLGSPLTLEHVQPLGVRIPEQPRSGGITLISKQDLKSRAPLTNEKHSRLWAGPPSGHTPDVGIFPVPDKSMTSSAPHIPKQTTALVPSTLRQFQKVKASLPTGQSITSRLSPSAPTAKSSIFGVSSTPLQISRPSLTQAPFAPEISLGLGIPSDSGKLLVPQTLPSSRQTVVYRGRSTHEQFLATEVPPTPGQLPISGATPTLVQPLKLEALKSRQFFITRGSLTPQPPLISKVPLAPRQPLISGVPSISGQIPSLWAPLSPGQPLVPGASSIPGELLESGLSTFSEQSQAFQPPATPEQSPYLQAPSIFKQHLAPRTLPRQASSLWIPPIPMHSPILWASPVSGKPQKGLSSSITSKRLAVISQKSKSALAHPRAPDFEVSQAPFTTKKFQMPGVSDTSEETKLLRETFAMEAFKTLQPHLMDYRTPTLQTPYIDEGALSTLMKPITSLPSLTTQLPQTSQISPSEWDQISRFPPIGKPWILTSVSGIKKPKMMVPPISLQDLEEKRYLVDVQAQRNNLILLNWATKTFGLPSQLHTTARNLIIETLHMDTIRLGYLFHKYIAFRLIQHARNNIIKRIKAIENTGKGYETQNLYIMLSRIDNYQKKVMQVWTEKQKSLEQKRNQCLRKITHLFSQLQEMYKLNLSQPIPLIIDKKHTPASTKFVQWPLLEDRKSDIFKKSRKQELREGRGEDIWSINSMKLRRQEDQTEAIWNADLSTSSYPIAEKTSIHSHWAKLGGYPDVPRLLQLDVQSTFRKSLASMQSR